MNFYTKKELKNDPTKWRVIAAAILFIMALTSAIYLIVNAVKNEGREAASADVPTSSPEANASVLEEKEAPRSADTSLEAELSEKFPVSDNQTQGTGAVPADFTAPAAYVAAESAAKAVEKTNFSFAVIGDSESYKDDENGYNPELVTALQEVSRAKPEFVVLSGDIIVADAGSENRRRIGIIKNLLDRYTPEYYVAFGKHDIECGRDCVDLWQEIFFNKKYAGKEEPRILYFSFDYGKTHFVLLSSDYPTKHTIDDEQLSWLDRDLAQNKQSHVIVTVHVPPVTFFKESAEKDHDMSINKTQQKKLNDLLQRYDVDLVISGHEHTFDHKVVNGIDYIIAGNIGNDTRYEDAQEGDIYSLIYVGENTITVKAVKLGGIVIKEFQVQN